MILIFILNLVYKKHRVLNAFNPFNIYTEFSIQEHAEFYMPLTLLIDILNLVYKKHTEF